MLPGAQKVLTSYWAVRSTMGSWPGHGWARPACSVAWASQPVPGSPSRVKCKWSTCAREADASSCVCGATSCGYWFHDIQGPWAKKHKNTALAA